MATERRKHKRFNVNISMKGQLLRKDKKTVLTEEIPLSSKDISQGGMRLDWPKEWKCSRCSKCLGWIFNFNCRFKDNTTNRINRTVDEEVAIKLIIDHEDGSHEIISKIAWSQDPDADESSYDVGINFTRLNKAAENKISELIG